MCSDYVRRRGGPSTWSFCFCFILRRCKVIYGNWSSSSLEMFFCEIWGRDKNIGNAEESRTYYRWWSETVQLQLLSNIFRSIFTIWQIDAVKQHCLRCNWGPFVAYCLQLWQFSIFNLKINIGSFPVNMTSPKWRGLSSQPRCQEPAWTFRMGSWCG
jgi:hypothetical protein